MGYAVRPCTVTGVFLGFALKGISEWVGMAFFRCICCRGMYLGFRSLEEGAGRMDTSVTYSYHEDCWVLAC